MKKTITLLLIGFGMACSVLAQGHHQNIGQRVEQLLELELKKSNVHNVFLSVYSPSHNFEWHSAKGSFKDGTEVTTDNPYYTASVGKTFTATAIGILIDQGKLQFDEPIAKYLPVKIMDNLHVLNGTDYRDSISISHLLQHTSGLPDYFDRETIDESPGIFDLIMTVPDRIWRPEELINFSKAHFRPSFPPGEGYYYTDTEYVLLGMIIENVSGLPLYEFFTKHIFTPLDMKHTYLNCRSSPIESTDQMAEMYAGEYEVSTFKSLSADWAGGAIVSTGKDLITFQSALMNAQLISETTLNAMQQWITETKGMHYGYGLRKVSFAKLSAELPEWEIIGHSGLNGTFMYYCPDLDIFLTGTLNQLESSKDGVILMVKVLMELAKL